MKTEPWLDRIEAKLHKAGLPKSYVQRTVCELNDHAKSSGRDDCWAQDADELAADFVHEFRRSRWYRRVPSILWLLLPIPLGILTCVATFGLGLIAFEISTDALERKNHVGLEAYALPWLFHAGLLIAPLVAVFLHLRIMEKVGRPRWVRHCSLGLLMFFFLASVADYQQPSKLQQGHLHLEFSDETVSQVSIANWSCVQVAIIAGVVWIEKRREQGLLQFERV